MSNNNRSFPDWENLYKSQNVESMPWFSELLDSDLELELSNNNITNGFFLDLGTGPGTQAFQLAQMGFDVTGSDVSPTSIQKALVRFASVPGKKVEFVIDNILESKLPDNEFDYVLDRGCFHVLEPAYRSKYVKEVHRILKKNGILFLKCFSEREPEREIGPYRFSPSRISDFFKTEGFKMRSFKETVYQGSLNPLPKALFIVLLK